jgi:hypothetical protein
VCMTMVLVLRLIDWTSDDLTMMAVGLGIRVVGIMTVVTALMILSFMNGVLAMIMSSPRRV